jgi:methyl acetate hydrolase
LLPDLAAPQVLEGFDAKGEPKLRPAKKPITLRHLMTHTAGFCYNLWNGDMATYLEKTGLPGVTTCKNDALRTPRSPPIPARAGNTASTSISSARPRKP